MGPDIITDFANTCTGLINNLPVSIYSFLLRSNLMLLLAAVFAEIGFNKGYRTRKAQLFWVALGMTVGISLPIEPLFHTRVFQVIKPWFMLALAAGAFYVLPGKVAFLLEPRLGQQLQLKKRITITLAVLFVLNLFSGGQV